MIGYKSVTGLAVVGLAIAVSRTSVADESKSYLGSSCRQEDSRVGQVAAGNGGGIRNIGAFPVNVICPIVKTVPDQGQIKEAYVYVDLGSPGPATASCTLNVYSSNLPQNAGHLLNQTSASVTGSGIPTPLALGPTSASLPAGWGSASASSAFSYYQINCTLDPGTELKNYRINETGTRSETKKTYPPSMCHAVAESTAVWYEIDGRLQTHPISGAGVTKGKFVCPIINDRMSNKSGITVDLSFGPPSNNLNNAACSVYETDSTGVVRASSSFTIAYNGQDTNSILHRFSLGATPATKNRYYLVCTISDNADAKLLGYRVEELGTTSDPANADGKVYSGATCEGEPYSTPSQIVQNSDGSGSNPSTVNYNSLYCPIITDNYGSTAGLSIARAYIKRAASGGGTSFCSTYSYTPSGIQPISVTRGRTSDPPSGSVDEQVNMPMASAPSNARYYMGCNLAPKSILEQYQIEER